MLPRKEREDLGWRETAKEGKSHIQKTQVGFGPVTKAEGLCHHLFDKPLFNYRFPASHHVRCRRFKIEVSWCPEVVHNLPGEGGECGNGTCCMAMMGLVSLEERAGPTAEEGSLGVVEATACTTDWLRPSFRRPSKWPSGLPRGAGKGEVRVVILERKMKNLMKYLYYFSSNHHEVHSYERYMGVM